MQCLFLVFPKFVGYNKITNLSGGASMTPKKIAVILVANVMF